MMRPKRHAYVVVRKDIFSDLESVEPSYMEPWEYEFNRRQPRSRIYTSKGRAYANALMLYKKGALEGVYEYELLGKLRDIGSILSRR